MGVALSCERGYGPEEAPRLGSYSPARNGGHDMDKSVIGKEACMHHRLDTSTLHITSHHITLKRTMTEDRASHHITKQLFVHSHTLRQEGRRIRIYLSLLSMTSSLGASIWCFIVTVKRMFVVGRQWEGGHLISHCVFDAGSQALLL